MHFILQKALFNIPTARSSRYRYASCLPTHHTQSQVSSVWSIAASLSIAMTMNFLLQITISVLHTLDNEDSWLSASECFRSSQQHMPGWQNNNATFDHLHSPWAFQCWKACWEDEKSAQWPFLKLVNYRFVGPSWQWFVHVIESDI